MLDDESEVDMFSSSCNALPVYDEPQCLAECDRFRKSTRVRFASAKIFNPSSKVTTVENSIIPTGIDNFYRSSFNLSIRVWEVEVEVGFGGNYLMRGIWNSTRTDSSDYFPGINNVWLPRSGVGLSYWEWYPESILPVELSGYISQTNIKHKCAIFRNSINATPSLSYSLRYTDKISAMTTYCTRGTLYVVDKLHVKLIYI